MGTEKNTAKVAPRSRESDTGKLDVSAISKAWRIAKDNPAVLVAVALLSGGGVGVGGGQVTVEQILQSAQWWQIALCVIGFGVLSWMSGVSKTLTKILVRLEVGNQRMTKTEDEVSDLKDWRRQQVDSQAAAAQFGRKPRKGSEGAMRPAPGGA